MSVIVRVIGVDSLGTKLNVLISKISSVVNETSPASSLCNDRLSISGETRGGVSACSCLADVIWGGRGDDDVGSLGVQEGGGVGEVGGVGLNDYTSGCGAGFATGAGAIGAEVVGWGGGSSIIMSEFDDDDIAGFDGIDDGSEAVFSSVGTG